MNDRDVVRTIEESRLMRVLAGALGWVSHIAESSTVVARARALGRRWNDESSWSRRRALGVMLMTAAGVHMLLRAADPPPGWLWTVIPAWGMLVGVLLFAMSSNALHERKS